MRMSRPIPCSKAEKMFACRTDVKAKLASFERLGLLGLIQDLYAAHKDSQTFPSHPFLDWARTF
jgi:hypothetical protein